MREVRECSTGESEGLHEGGEDGWGVCMPNGGWRPTRHFFECKRSSPQIHTTSKRTHGSRCKRPFPSCRRLRIEQRLNGCGRNRNEKGKKGRDGTAGRPANVFAHRRSRRGYELIFINVKGREGGRMVDVSGRSAR